MKAKDFIAMALKAAKSSTIYDNTPGYNIGNWDGNYFHFDCTGLIKAILWGWNGGDGSLQYIDKNGRITNGVADFSTETMYQYCSGGLSTDFSTIVPGEVLWMPGHAGIYIGKNESGTPLVVESTHNNVNNIHKVYITKIASNYDVRQEPYCLNLWVSHGKLTSYIDYSDITNENINYSITTEKIDLNQEDINLTDFQDEKTIIFTFRDSNPIKYTIQTTSSINASVSTNNINGQKYTNGKILWGVGLKLKLPPALMAGLIGHLCGESQLDPTAVEGFGASYNLSDAKAQLFNENNISSAMEPYTFSLFEKYANAGLSIYKNAYLVYGQYAAGIGLAGFTGPIVEKLFSFANYYKTNWYDFNCQAAAIFCILAYSEYNSRYNTYISEYSDAVECAARVAMGTFGFPAYHIYRGNELFIDYRISEAKQWYELFENLTLSDFSADEKTSIDQIYYYIQNYNANLLQPIDTKAELVPFFIRFIQAYDITVDLTELIDPYLIHTVTINGEIIKVDNNMLILQNAINNYISKKVKEYKNTQYLQINHNIYSLIENTPTLDISNDIINTIKEQVEDKIEWH